MDPMLEIARGFLRTEREAASRVPERGEEDTSNAHSRYIFPKDIYTDIDRGIEELAKTRQTIQAIDSAVGLQDYLWSTQWSIRDERAQEILADVFYAKSHIPRRLCEINKELIPGFVHYLAEEAHQCWQTEKSGDESVVSTKEQLRKLFEEYKYAVHEKFPDAFELALIENPRFMLALAKLLRTALPFSMVLRKELEEICQSRQVRLHFDTDAQKARILDEILRVRFRLTRLRDIGDEGVQKREENRLERKKSDLKVMIDHDQEQGTRQYIEEKQPQSERKGAAGRVPSGASGKRPFFSSLRILGAKSPLDTAATSPPGPTAGGPSQSLPPPSRPPAGKFRFPPIQAEDMSLFGLALSGGGIRSATFNLGVLQGLADLDLLRQVDYLSAVSGGSHIAAWLAAWIKREPNGIRRVQRWLSPLRSPTPDTDETHPVQFLRRFSNYLAPKKSFLSPDMWSIFTIWLRNTLLNQLVFVLLMASLLTAPKLVFEALERSRLLFPGPNDSWLGGATLLLAIGLASLAGMNLHRFDPGVQARIERRKTPFFLWTQFGVWITIVLGCMVLGLAGAALIFYNGDLFWSRKWGWAIFSGAIMAVLVSLQLASRAWRYFLPKRPGVVPSVRQKTKGITAVFLASAVCASIGGAIFEAVVHGYEERRHIPSLLSSEKMHMRFWLNFMHINFWPNFIPGDEQWQTSIMVVLGPSLVLGVLAIVMLLLIGLMGHNLSDNRREWWGRMGAMLLLVLGGWAALSACSLWAPAAVMWMWAVKRRGYSIVLWFLWVTVTAVGSRWGFSGRTPPGVLENDPIGWKSLRSMVRAVPQRWIAVIAPYVYIAGLAILVSFFLYAIPLWTHVSSPLEFFQDKLPSSTLRNLIYWDQLSVVDHRWFLPALFIATATLAAILAWRFDVNEFSMHSLYRNRLVRCYLGASRAGQRDPNPFTGFDSEDDMRLSLLRVDPPVPKDLSRAARPYRGPFPIFNAALNLVAGKELAWQERKAASFVFTPLYCGYEFGKETAYYQNHFANFGYRPTEDYAEPDSLGPALGTSMAASGAAANPNMGYHSSPALGFLMTLFNVRLGCWMGNPRHRTTWKLSSPTAGLAYLVNELIGRTNDTSRFVNLSDGGHFENLGIYELVRRHCMYIIACDAEEDPPFSFPGLANAIRKCRADFGVDIRLDPDQLRPVFTTGEDQGRSRAHCAIGDIVYSPETIGKLLYIKTSLTGDEPGDVLSYKLHYSAFPHQSTFNQFFNESQFESYRALGQHIAMAILQRASEYTSDNIPKGPEPAAARSEQTDCLDSSEPPNRKFLEGVFKSLKAMWYPPATNMVALRDRHRKLYDELIDMFRASDQESLRAARVFFRIKHPRGAFLAYSKMIELMYRVFQDLDLEIMVDHPSNECWMNMFRGWAGNPDFQAAWKDARDNYDNRFKKFCNKELELKLAEGSRDGRKF